MKITSFSEWNSLPKYLMIRMIRISLRRMWCLIHIILICQCILICRSINFSQSESTLFVIRLVSNKQCPCFYLDLRDFPSQTVLLRRAMNEFSGSQMPPVPCTQRAMVCQAWPGRGCHPLPSGASPEQNRQQPLAPGQGLNQRLSQAVARLSLCTAGSVHSWGIPQLRAEIILAGLWSILWHRHSFFFHNPFYFSLSLLFLLYPFWEAITKMILHTKDVDYHSIKPPSDIITD